LNKKRYRPLEKKLGYRFKKSNLLAMALTHRSFRFENDGVDTDNQRLEFLGDAILGMIAATHLYRVFEESDEGVLTRLRSRLTSGKMLARIAASLELGQELDIGKGEERTGGRSRPSNLADALESVLGAVYLDGGLKAAEKVFAKLFLPVLDEYRIDAWHDNPKGRLQEVSQQKWRAAPRYRVVEESGPAHERNFVIDVFLNGTVAGRGEGTSKRTAEMNAALSAMKSIGGSDQDE